MIRPRPRGVPRSEPSTAVRCPPPDTVLAYAAGASPPDEELLVACHLTFCPDCRATVDAGEAVGAALAFAEAPAVPASWWAAVSARLNEPVAPPAPRRIAEVALPAPFVARFGPFDALPLRPVGLGVRVARLSAPGDDARTFLVDFPPGLRVPDHDHHGTERGIVLRGGYAHGGERFGPGDVEWRQAPHRGIRIDPEGPCTALFVADGPLRLGARWVDALADRWLFG